MKRLDFLVIGAQKSGTTTLWQLLRDHPQLAFHESKEAPFFTDVTRFRRGLEWYLDRFFAEADPDALWGSVSPQCMTGVTGPGARGYPIEQIAARVANTVPDVKLIALVRDPVERAISHYRMSKRRGIEERALVRALRQQLRPAALVAARARPSECNGYIVFGEYGRIIAAFRRHFPPEALLVLLTSELDRDPDGVVRQVFGFLGVDQSWRPDQIEQRRLIGGDELRIPVDQAEDLLSALTAPLPPKLVGALRLAFEEWNTVASPAIEPLPNELQRRLAEHYAQDGARLQELCSVAVPWAAPPPRRRAPSVQRPEVSLLVLAHDTPREVDALLASIVLHTRERYELLLIDNGSSFAKRDAHAELADTYGARFIPLDANVTFSIANNMGLRVSSAEEVVFLNSDVVVTRNWLRNMRAALHSAPNIGLVGPRTNFSNVLQGGVWLDDSSPAGVQRFGRFFNHADPSRWFELEWLAGFTLLARRQALDAVGGFDETLPWHGLEDKALGAAIHAAGWRAMCAGDTFVYHSGHRTFEDTGVNRTATRVQRRAAPAPDDSDPGRLLSDDQGHVYEVRDGVACQLELLPALVSDGRPIDSAGPGDLELPTGPPITICRIRGTDEVWVIHCGRRRRVTGDPQRIRRLPWVWMAEARDLEPLARGLDIQVGAALPPVPQIEPRLPFNPAETALGRLAGTEQVLAELRVALARDDGYALIRIERDDVLMLNEELWPTSYNGRGRAAAPSDRHHAGTALRQAITSADALGVPTDRSDPDGVMLLERLLFHYDLYPRLRCSARINYELLGLAGETATGGHAPLAGLLKGRRPALVCPNDLAAPAGLEPNRSWQRERGFKFVRIFGLDDLEELDSAFEALAAERHVYDVVLVAGGVAAKLLCSLLARRLDVVALDLGSAFGEVVYPRW